MRMPTDHLRVNVVDDVADIEAAGFTRNFRVKNNLEQQIAEFAHKVLRIAGIEGIEDFVCLLDQIAPKRVMRLLAIPGTSARGPQSRLQRDQALEKRANGVFLAFLGRFSGPFVARFRDEPLCGSALRCSGFPRRTGAERFEICLAAFRLADLGADTIADYPVALTY
jgi:hypothetical protein